MKLEKIIKGITVNEIIGDASQEISGINMDSRLIEPGHIFVAVKGTQTDGHTYIQKAIEKGARTVVCENLPETLIENVTYIKVNDTEDVVGKLATTFYGDPTSKLNWSVLQAPTEKRLLPPYYIICSVNSDIRQDSFPLYAII